MKRFTVIIIIVLLSSCNNNEFYEYKPTYLRNGAFVKSDTSYSEQHKQNIIQVLLYNKIEIKEIKGRLFYRGKIDDELLWNYTTKANDSTWLSTHHK
jgi:hypothetical protein